ncbi:MAG: tRNA pseudouridine(38-40) synthase TruA [Candidatus Omnitrophica bacterium]|nr:tRNA pseudouridine(38-40) synthase TruA [Candidatus Omnitrophota bacterium]
MDNLKIKLVLGYDGTEYAGWQMQTSGIAVQQKVEEALGKLFPGTHRVHSSSRTDAGVHALGMVVHVEIPRADFKMSPGKLVLAMNAHLPPDIRVMVATRCRKDFHARFDAVGKQYRYLVWNHRAQHPLLRLYAWHVPQTLDLAAMRAAALHLVGRHDFRSFAANRNYPLSHSVRTLRRCAIRRQGALLTFIIEGDGFLYRMCRGIVGTLVQVGQGKIQPDEMSGILAGKDRRVAGMSAPAHGLILWKVLYGSEKEA